MGYDLRGNEEITTPDLRGRILACAEELHRLMRLSRRNRWRYSPTRKRQDPDGGIILSARELWRSEAMDLCMAICNTVYGAEEGPILSVYFWKPDSARVRSALRVRYAPDNRGTRWSESLAIRSLPVELQQFWLRHTRGVRRQRVERARQQKDEQAQREQAERARKAGAGWWWIHPEKTPPSQTALAILLHVVRVGLISLEEDSLQGKSLEGMIGIVRDALPRGTARQLDEDGNDAGILYPALKKLVTSFDLPPDWQALPSYLRQVVRSVLNRRSEKLDNFAAEYGISRSSVYAWLSEAKRKQGRARSSRQLGKGIWDQLRARGQARSIRRKMIAALVRKGWAEERARKWVYRRRQKGKSDISVMREIDRLPDCDQDMDSG